MVLSHLGLNDFHIKLKTTFSIDSGTKQLKYPKEQQILVPGDEVDPWTHAQNVLKQTREGCNFCDENYLKLTAQDPFGRIDSVPGLLFFIGCSGYFSLVGLAIFNGSLSSWALVVPLPLFIDVSKLFTFLWSLDISSGPIL